MNILICTDGEEDAEHAIQFGGHIARGLDADITVLHVSTDPLHLDRSSLTTTRKNLRDWQSGIHGILYLDRASQTLSKMGLSRSIPTTSPKDRFTFRETPEGGFILHRLGHSAKRVRFKLREGEPADEILIEAQQGGYDLVITGARGYPESAPFVVGSTAMRTAEFAPCSILIAKNIKKPNHFLVCTDGSQHAEQAELLAAKFAQAVSAKATVLSVASSGDEEPLAKDRVRRAEMVLNQLGLLAGVKILIGRPSDVIIQEAREHDLVVMGASGSSAVRRFFLGSVPLKVIEYGECPVLLVREKPRQDGV